MRLPVDFGDAIFVDLSVFFHTNKSNVKTQSVGKIINQRKIKYGSNPKLEGYVSQYLTDSD